MHTHMCLEAQEMRDMKKSWDTIFIVMYIIFLVHYVVYLLLLLLLLLFFFCEANILKIKG
jgi:hypothetical protein